MDVVRAQALGVVREAPRMGCFRLFACDVVGRANVPNLEMKVTRLFCCVSMFSLPAATQSATTMTMFCLHDRSIDSRRTECWIGDMVLSCLSHCVHRCHGYHTPETL